MSCEIRIKTNLGELDKYLDELKAIIPKKYENYVSSIETKRACERLAHISIECVIDICAVLVAELKLGPPAEEESIFDKLEEKHIMSNKLIKKLRMMKKFRNILVHQYGKVDDSLVYKNLVSKLNYFYIFKKEVLKIIKN
ncbi:MAG: DUF86 domain-containing protein [Candidatus Aenigmarchaeota archaeon]|nr:DUF86 domain-containing protein [Candidatus Aenigmarchaeota archaeon]